MKKERLLLLITSTLTFTLAIYLLVALYTPQPTQPNPADVLNRPQLPEPVELVANVPAFKDYVSDHINELSPEPAVLGGTFYVTNFAFPSPNTSFVSYEDGHVAYEAMVEYNYIGDKIEIINFGIIPVVDYLSGEQTLQRELPQNIEGNDSDILIEEGETETRIDTIELE